MTDHARIVLASAGALLSAALLLITVVLPAEYGWDPLGSGRILGLVGMADSQVPALHRHDQRWRTDRIEFPLAPFESVEYKYRLESGDTMLYQWRTEANVLFEMHAEPDGAAPGYAETFDKAEGHTRSGSYTAPFPGIHGWYWQNRSQQDITIVLETRGYFSAAIELRDGREFSYKLSE